MQPYKKENPIIVFFSFYHSIINFILVYSKKHHEYSEYKSNKMEKEAYNISSGTVF